MKQYQLPTPPDGAMYTNNTKLLNSIFEALATKTNGMCPCVPSYLHDNEDYRCPCKQAKENKSCKCGIFVWYK